MSSILQHYRRSAVSRSHWLIVSHPGDGQRPTCSPCQRGSRDCAWLAFIDNAPLSRRPTTSATTPSTSRKSVSEQSNSFVTTRNPELALQDPRVARLFRHYIDNLAAWYDLTDRRRHFADVVPVRARQNSLLLSAILAFSAASKNYSDPEVGLMDQAAFYHLESVHILINLTRNGHVDNIISDGEVLAAICLLRSNEVICRELTRILPNQV